MEKGDKQMKTWNELWGYMCDKGEARNAVQFYVSDPNEVAKAYWNGVLTALEMEGVITRDDANEIWCEIDKDFAKIYRKKVK